MSRAGSEGHCALRHWRSAWPSLTRMASSATACTGRMPAMMMCSTPSVMRSDHVHFIDGACGGYASAATAPKAMVT